MISRETLIMRILLYTRLLSIQSNSRTIVSRVTLVSCLYIFQISLNHHK